MMFHTSISTGRFLQQDVRGACRQCSCSGWLDQQPLQRFFPAALSAALNARLSQVAVRWLHKAVTAVCHHNTMSLERHASERHASGISPVASPSTLQASQCNAHKQAVMGQQTHQRLS